MRQRALAVSALALAAHPGCAQEADRPSYTAAEFCAADVVEEMHPSNGDHIEIPLEDGSVTYGAADEIEGLGLQTAQINVAPDGTVIIANLVYIAPEELPGAQGRGLTGQFIVSAQMLPGQDETLLVQPAGLQGQTPFAMFINSLRSRVTISLGTMDQAYAECLSRVAADRSLLQQPRRQPGG